MICHWVKKPFNILITGPTGVTPWIACCLAQKAYREGHTVLYLRLPRLLQDLALAKGDGRYNKLFNRIGKIDVPLLDDWGLATLTAEQRRDLLEGRSSRLALNPHYQSIAAASMACQHWRFNIG